MVKGQNTQYQAFELASSLPSKAIAARTKRQVSKIKTLGIREYRQKECAAPQTEPRKPPRKVKREQIVRLAVLQFAPQTRSETDNVKFIVKHVAHLRDAIIVLPEFFLSSYRNYPLFFIKEDDLESVLAPLVNLSRLRNLTFVGSLPVHSDGEDFNRAIYISSGKVHQIYDKVRLFGQEQDKFNTGTTAQNIIDIDGVKCSVQICMDIVDPLPMQSRRLRDVQIILGPSTVSVDFLRTIHKARALENQVVSVFCNRSGFEPGDRTYYLGQSAIFFPDGSERCLNADVEDLELVELTRSDLDAIAARRQEFLGPREA